jgi:hypothetical protein
MSLPQVDALRVLLILGAAKLVATTFSYSSGGEGRVVTRGQHVALDMNDIAAAPEKFQSTCRRRPWQCRSPAEGSCCRGKGSAFLASPWPEQLAGKILGRLGPRPGRQATRLCRRLRRWAAGPSEEIARASSFASAEVPEPPLQWRGCRLAV